MYIALNDYNLMWRCNYSLVFFKCHSLLGPNHCEGNATGTQNATKHTLQCQIFAVFFWAQWLLIFFSSPLKCYNKTAYKIIFD